MHATLRLTQLLILATALSCASQAAAQALKIGVFDAQVVSESTEMGKRIQADLNTFTKRKEVEIAERQTQVAGLRKKLSEQALSLSPSKRSELEMDIQRHALDLQSFQEAATRELELEYASATRDFRDKLIVAVQTFGRDDGFSLILDRNQIAWASAGIDVTSAIIDRFNQMFPGTTE